MFRSLVWISAPLSLLLLVACTEADPPFSPGEDESAPAYEIEAVEGNHQYGRTGMYFEDHLVVRVSDREGNPVPGARVEWEVLEGPVFVSQPSSLTNGNGRAKVTLDTGMQLGDVTVRARVASMPDVDTFFDAKVSAYLVVMKSDQYKVQTPGSDFTVSVGDTIEWLNKDMTDEGGTEHFMHSATSVQEPAGGRSFDSGMLAFDDTYRWAPETTGTWEYECKDHPQSERMAGTIHVTGE